MEWTGKIASEEERSLLRRVRAGVTVPLFRAEGEAFPLRVDEDAGLAATRSLLVGEGAVRILGGLTFNFSIIS